MVSNMSSNNFILNRFFTRRIFQDLINNKENSVYTSCVERYTNNTKDLKQKQLISYLYKYMSKKYRNEYYYKNTLLNKLLLGKHSLNTTTALAELPIHNSKADLVLINGKGTVYEIKTELDNFDRLENQLGDYYKAFNRVCVVTSEANYDKVDDKLKNTTVGICVLTDKNTINIKKEPIESTKFLSHTSIFKVLRKKEYENIVQMHYGDLPKVPQVHYFKECLRLFTKIEINQAQRYMLRELKKRNIEEKEAFLEVPYELKYLVYFSKFKSKDYFLLNQFLNKTWGE